MKVHDISINRKYFEPIRKGRISLLIFKTKVLTDEQPGDYILASYGSYDIKAKITQTYIKAFRDITEEEARKAGFLNKDFLKDELISSFDIKPKFNTFIENEVLDDELFFLIKLNVTDEHYFINNKSEVTLYSKEFNKEFYNPEYDTKPWEEYDEEL